MSRVLRQWKNECLRVLPLIKRKVILDSEKVEPWRYYLKVSRRYNGKDFGDCVWLCYVLRPLEPRMQPLKLPSVVEQSETIKFIYNFYGSKGHTMWPLRLQDTRQKCTGILNLNEDRGLVSLLYRFPSCQRFWNGLTSCFHF